MLVDIYRHDDVIKWKHFPRYWPFAGGVHRSPVNSLHKGQWRGALMFSLICTWIYDWVNNREAGDLRHHRAHYDVTVIEVPWLTGAWSHIGQYYRFIGCAKQPTEHYLNQHEITHTCYVVLPELILTYCLLDPKEQTSVKISIKLDQFRVRNCI